MLRTLFVCLWSVRRPAARPSASGIVGALVLLAHAPAVLAEERASETAEADPAGRGEATPATGDSGGLRGALLRRGIAIEAEIRADSSANLSGGLRPGGAVRGPVLVGLTIDTAPLLGWPGGRLFAGFQAHQGRNGSAALVGDAQGFDNVDAVRLRQISELWYEQGLFHGKLRLRVGKQDANRDFAFVENAGDFLNSSAGFSPTIQGFPSYPDPATGASLSIVPRPWLYSSAGVYDGATHEGCHGRTGNRGPGTLWGDPDALFLIAETGLRWTVGGGLSGRLAAGGWRQTGRFERFEGGQADGTAGTYMVFEQALWPADARRHGGRRVAVFAQLGWADGRVSDLDRHWSTGVTWTGPLPGRDRDVLGAMVSTVRFADASAAGRLEPCETALEAFYKLQLLSWAALQPDVQIVANPAAQSIRRAIVGTMRVQLAF
jgi:carbohydrate-selective porin OprB